MTNKLDVEHYRYCRHFWLEYIRQELGKRSKREVQNGRLYLASLRAQFYHPPVGTPKAKATL